MLISYKNIFISLHILLTSQSELVCIKHITSLKSSWIAPLTSNISWSSPSELVYLKIKGPIEFIEHSTPGNYADLQSIQVDTKIQIGNLTHILTMFNVVLDEHDTVEGALQ